VQKGHINETVLTNGNVRGYAVTITGNSINLVTLLENRPSYHFSSNATSPFTAAVVEKQIRTDSMVVGRLSVVYPTTAGYYDRLRHARPAPAGVSIGNLRSNSAGTLGGIMRVNNTPYFLSNSHVLAPYGYEMNDIIIQPGRIDGGTARDRIGLLTDVADPDPSRYNFVDAALGRPDSGADLVDDILGYGPLKGSANVVLGATVRKSGRTTGPTVGNVIAIEATVKINYGSTLVYFRDQMIIEGAGQQFSQPGDSGSLILDSNNKAMGLLFAGSEFTTIATPISYVLDRFNAEAWVS
jgi:hypothetical protein